MSTVPSEPLQPDAPRTESRSTFERGLALGLGLGLGLALMVGAGVWLQLRQNVVAAPAPVEPAPLPAVEAPVTRAVPNRWRALTADAPLASAKEVAFAQDAALWTDGEAAVYQAPDGETYPLEIAAEVGRVYEAGGKLYALAENEDAPFLIAIDPASPKVEPVVLTLPCPFERLAGDGKVLAGVCAGSEAVAVSDNGGRSFRRHALRPPTPEGVDPNATRVAVEALAVSPDGKLAIAVVQRWWQLGRTEPLLWTWANVGIGSGRSFSWSSLPGVASVPAIVAGHGAYLLVALEVDAEGGAEGELMPRTWRGGEQGFSPAGVAGESCTAVEHAEEIRAVALSEREIAVLCAGELIGTLDGGRSWERETGLDGSLTSLAGGDMRLLVRGEKGSWERKFVLRSAQGATAVRLPKAPDEAKNAVLEKIPLAPLPKLGESAPDAGER